MKLRGACAQEEAVIKIDSLTAGQIKLWSMGLFAIAVLFSGVTWQVVSDRKSALETAEKTTQQLALALEAGVVGILKSAERVAHHVGAVTVANLNSTGTPTEDAHEFWQEMLGDVPFLHAVSFIRTDGVIPTTAVRWPDQSIKLINQTYDGAKWQTFRTHLESEQDQLFVGQPIQSFFIEDKWILHLTLPQRNLDGRFLGVVYVDIALDTFIDLFSEVRTDGKSSITVFNDDGVLMFSNPFLENIVGSSFADIGLFTERLKRSPVGTYQSLTLETQDMRILTYRAIEGWPLVLTFDLSLSEVFARWRQRAFFYSLAAIGASVVIFLLTLWLSRQIRRDEQTRLTLTFREQSLEESQRLAGVGHFERDLRTEEIAWADNMYAIHGVSPATFTPGRGSFLELVHESVKNVIRDQVHHFDSPPSDGHFECQIIRPDNGAMRDMVYDWRVIRDRDGVPIKSFGVARDVTGLKESERTLRENEARLQDITECMSDFVWEVDKDGVLTYFESGANDPLIEIELGVTKDENINFDVGAGDHAFIAKAFADKESFRNLNLPLRNKEQETRWIRISGNPMFDNGGQFFGFRGAGADITEQRQQGIYEIEKTKSDALARLAGGMAHEINNLLQPVIVYSSMGENEPLEKIRNDGYFRKIFTASQQAISIVQDVLTFAREGRDMPEPVPLGATLIDILDILKPTLPKTIKIIGPVTDTPVNVAANSGGLHQVMINLVRNAVDAVDGKGTIRVNVGSVAFNSTDASRRSVLPGNYGYFSLADDGPGLEDETVSKVFDPFFSTKPTGIGTGLGLSVVVGLVKGWGGLVDVSSRPGQTVFTVYVPLVSSVREAAE